MPLDGTQPKATTASLATTAKQQTTKQATTAVTKSRTPGQRGQRQVSKADYVIMQDENETSEVGPITRQNNTESNRDPASGRSTKEARSQQQSPTPRCAAGPSRSASSNASAGSRRAPPPPPVTLKATSSKSMDQANKLRSSGHSASSTSSSKQRAATSAQRQTKETVARSESTRRLVEDLEDSFAEQPMNECGAATSGGGGVVVADFANCDSSSLGSTGTGGVVPVGSGGDGGGSDNGSGVGRFGQTGRLLTRNLAWAVFASTVGSSFQHGYNGGVVNAPQKLIGEFINQTYKQRHGEYASETQVDFIIAIIVSIFCIGGCVGALLTAFVADRIGRKEGLMYNNLIVLVASPLMASAKSMSSYELLILGRLLIGVNAGLNAGLAPLYLNEIAPVQLRGALGTIYQLVIAISILLSNIFGLPSLLGDEGSWPILFALPILPAAFMLAALPHLCESPKHLLLNQGKELQAQQALAWLRQTGDVQDEMEELRNERELNIMMNNRCVTLGDMLSERSLRKPLTIAIVIMLSQQFSGINAVLFYSTSIFRDAGLSEHGAVQATLGMGVVNVAMTLVSLFLVDRAGRRTLHMTGLMGMAATCLVLALCLNTKSTSQSHFSPISSSLAVVSVYVFIAMFASGPGAIPWFLVAELFPSNARPLASSIAVSVNWLANFTVSLCFLPLSNLLHGFTFVLFAILLVIFYLFTYYKVPETKGATSEEISALFRH